MRVKELLEEIEKIRKDYPNIDEMEIGPVFNDDVVMMISDLTIEKDSGWDGKDAVGIIWHC